MIFILFFLSFCGVIGYGLWLDMGKVFVEWGGYEIHFTGLGFCLFVLSLWIFIWFFTFIFFKIPSRIKTQFKNHSKKRNEDLLASALESFILKNEPSCKKTLQKINPAVLSNAQVLSLGFVMDALKMENELAGVLQALGGHSAFFQLKKAQDLFQKEAYGEALKHLDLLPSSPLTFKLKGEAYLQTKDFQRATHLLEKARGMIGQNNIIQEAKLLQTWAKEGAHPSPYQALKEAHLLCPEDPTIALDLAKACKDNKGEALRVIETTWSHHPTPELAQKYMQLHQQSLPVEKFKEAQRLASFNAKHKESYALLAEAAFVADLWSDARHYYTELARRFEDARGYLGLSKLTPDLKESKKVLEEGLLTMLKSPPGV